MMIKKNKNITYINPYSVHVATIQHENERWTNQFITNNYKL